MGVKHLLLGGPRMRWDTT